MSTPEQPQGFRFQDPRDARIFERLRRLIGEGTAQFFRDACRIFSGQPALDSASHMAAHGLREVESALRQILEPFEDGAPLPKGTKKAHEQSVRKVCRGLQVPNDDPLLAAWLAVTGEDNPDALHRRAHRDDLNPPRPLDASWLDRVITVFDAVLEKAEASYSVVFRALDALLPKTQPDSGDIDWLKSRVPGTPLTHGYFFDRLAHGAWLEPLAAAGLLTRVLPLDRNEEEGTIGFPPWPAKPYLLRMAQTGDLDLQARVLAVLKSVPDTDNTRVHADVAEIALALPAEMSRELVGFVDRGLRQPYHLFLPQRTAPLIVYLAESGHLSEAGALARTLFEVLPDPTPPKAVGSTPLPPTPRARVQDVFYDRELKAVASALIEANPFEAVKIFSDLLETAVRLSQTNGGDGRRAYSEIWTPRLDETGRHHGEPRDELLQTLVLAATAAAAKAPDRLPELIGLLEARGWWVFKRVALHVAASMDAASAEATNLLAEQVNMIEEPEVRTEYIALLKKRFPQLPARTQEAVLVQLSAQPDLAEHRRSLEEWLGRVVSDEEVSRDIRRRRYARLQPLAEHLPTGLQEDFAGWTREFEDEATPSGPAGWRGERSPKTTEELLSMSDHDLVSYLKEAEFGHDPFGPSMEGLGESLAAAAARAPDRFSRVAQQFEDLDPSLVSGILRGLEVAVKAKHPIAWQKVLHLCRWIVEQPRTIPGRTTRYSDLDPGWAWTRQQIASLVLQGLQDQPEALDISLRTEVWPIIEILLTDPDPESSRTREDDPLTTAMNSVRGEAIRAVMVYGLWVRRSDPGGKGFESMPEVRNALEAHLDVLLDPSPAIRAVYGECLGIVYYLDDAWLRTSLPKILPPDPSEATLWRAAWESYVRYRPPLIPLLPELDLHYRRATEEAGTEGEPAKRPDSAAHRLAEHIMVLTWQGKVNLEDPENLAHHFFEHAPSSLRAHAIGFVGRSLKNTEGLISDTLLTSMQQLWDWRVQVLRVAPVESAREELAAFGWWFASRKFKSEWALPRLQEVLTLAGRIEWEHEVIEVLGELSEDAPTACVECLDLIMRNDKDRWGLDLAMQPTRKILEVALRLGDAEARRQARDVINRLASRGRHEFRDLLG